MENFESINENPDAFVESLSTEELVSIIEEASDLYYNGYGSGLDDNTYDALIWHLNKRYKQLKMSYKKIGCKPREKIRTQLPYFMPSLNKVKVGKDLISFLASHSSFTWSVKLDGVSGMVTYEGGKAQKVFLRGNGDVGGDISHVIGHISFPDLSSPTLPKDMVVRGEFVMRHDTWKEKYVQSKSVGNVGISRNFVSGKLNAVNVDWETLPDITFVAFDVVHLSGNSLPKPSDCFKLLEEEGFNVVKHGSFQNPLASTIVNMYQNEFENYEYPIDGIVVAIDQPRFAPQILENPPHTVAFKMNLVTQIRTTEIVDVRWQISRHGRYIPVAEFKSVYIDGRKIHRATAHNARRCVKVWGLTQGTKIKVTASGGVIPKILEVIKDEEEGEGGEGGGEDRGGRENEDEGDGFSQPILPPDTYQWKWKGADIVLIDPESCPEVHLKRHIHFFTSIRIPGIREGMLKRMRESGLDNLQAIINADQARFKQVRGIGAKKAKTYYDSIRIQIANAKLYRLMLASCTFGSGMGKTYLRQISVKVPTFLHEDSLKPKLIKIRGIGNKRADIFLEGLERFKNFLEDYQQVEENNRKYFEELAQQGFNPMVKNHGFVFTNLEDDDLEDYILDHQGSMQKAVNSETKAVITGNLLDVTAKQRKACELGVKVYTVEEFKMHFNITV